MSGAHFVYYYLKALIAVWKVASISSAAAVAGVNKSAYYNASVLQKEILSSHVGTYRSKREELIREGGGAIAEGDQILLNGGEGTVIGDGNKSWLSGRELS